MVLLTHRAQQTVLDFDLRALELLQQSFFVPELAVELLLLLKKRLLGVSVGRGHGAVLVDRLLVRAMCLLPLRVPSTLALKVVSLGLRVVCCAQQVGNLVAQDVGEALADVVEVLETGVQVRTQPVTWLLPVHDQGRRSCPTQRF